MIRDPSDGTVRTVVDEKPQSLSTRAAKINADKDLMSSTTSGPDTGLRQPTRTDAQERLERSREWLKQYQQAVRDANNMNDKGEVTNARGKADAETAAGLRSSRVGLEQQSDSDKAGR